MIIVRWSCSFHKVCEGLQDDSFRFYTSFAGFPSGNICILCMKKRITDVVRMLHMSGYEFSFFMDFTDVCPQVVDKTVRDFIGPLSSFTRLGFHT